MSPSDHVTAQDRAAPVAGNGLAARPLTRLPDRLRVLAVAIHDRGVARRAPRRRQPVDRPAHRGLAEALAIGLGCDSLRSSGRRAPR